MYQPLADRIRPQTLDHVVGQRHILGENGLLRRIVDSGNIPNMVFYGPSGTGKTTVADIIAKRSGRTLRRLNATTASLADVREVMDQVGTLLAPNGVLLYLDEIQYFNKKQQQTLLDYIETGKITLIASTTENPYFTIFNAILSRSTVFEFKALTPEDLLPAVERAVAQLAPKAAEKGVELAIRQAEGTAVFDPKWTEEALCNLLDNAVKYTPAGGAVSVEVKNYELFSAIRVSDTGPGIPEEEQAKIFGRFYRAPGAYQTEGVGIGLYLTRQIAEKQGGYVKVESAPGKGSVFSLFLPRP